MLPPRLQELSFWFQRELGLDGVFESVCKALWRAVLTVSGVLEPKFLANSKCAPEPSSHSSMHECKTLCQKDGLVQAGRP